MAFVRIQNSETNITESIFDVVLGIYNDANYLYFTSNDPNYYDKFSITIDQLEGEINVPYQYVDEVLQMDLEYLQSLS